MNVSDIASVATSMSQVKLSNSVGVSLLKMGMETLEENGEALQKLMELSVNPGLGANIDVSV